MKLILLISLLLINACSPIFNAGNIVHGVFTKNTFSTILGVGDTVVKEKTGKSFGGLFLKKIIKNDNLKSNNEKEINKELKWIFK